MQAVLRSFVKEAASFSGRGEKTGPQAGEACRKAVILLFLRLRPVPGGLDTVSRYI